MNREPARIPPQVYAPIEWRFFIDGLPWLPDRLSALDAELRRREILGRLDQLGPREFIVITSEVPLAR